MFIRSRLPGLVSRHTAACCRERLNRISAASGTWGLEMPPKTRRSAKAQPVEVPSDSDQPTVEQPKQPQVLLRGNRQRGRPDAGPEGDLSRSPNSPRKRARRRPGEIGPVSIGATGVLDQDDGVALQTSMDLEDPPPDIETLMESVVKVFCMHSEPNFSLPWQRKRQYSSTSSGFIIPGNRILTNAHCVDHHTQVKVRRRGSDIKYVAHVLSFGTECDIAMLTVEDPEFWQDLKPVRFGQLPKLQDAVVVIGFPIGGDTMSVTSGVVSRIEVTSYAHGSAELLGIQIDAAINSGNSGGPSFNSRGECVGIAFQSLKSEEAELVGYVIPPPVIQHFIEDYAKNGCFTAFPSLGIEWQKLENPQMRRALGLKPGQKGVRIRRTDPTAPVSKQMSAGAILLSFDGVDIANDGTVPFRSGERISFSFLISTKFTGDTAELRVLQDGQEKSITAELVQPKRLVPVHIQNQPPTYFIIAGLVFTQVTVPYLRSEYGKEFDFEAPVKLLDRLMHSMPSSRQQQVIVLGQVLAADVNIGYEDIVNTQVAKVNGQPAENLAELVRLVETCESEFLSFDLEYNQVIVMETKAARSANKAILQQHQIPYDRSVDLREASGLVVEANGTTS